MTGIQTNSLIKRTVDLPPFSDNEFLASQKKADKILDDAFRTVGVRNGKQF